MSSPLEVQRPRSLWRNVSFLLMWSSVAASGFGDRMIQLGAEPLLGVYEEGASAARIQAGIMFFFFVPYMLLTLLGGYLADSLPRKWIMFACDEGRAVMLFIAMWMAWDLGPAEAIPQDHHWKVYLLMAGTGVFAAIFNPARQSTVPQIVAPNHLQSANAVIGGIALIASLLGVLVGGPIVEHVSVRLGIGIGMGAYLISGWFFPFMRVQHRAPPKQARPGLGAIFADGVGYLRSHRVVRNLVVLNILFWAAAYTVNAAIAALVLSHYDIEPANYLTSKSIMLGTLGVGMIMGCFYVMWLREQRESGLVSMVALFVAGASMFGLALNRSYEFALVLAFVAGFSGGVFMICVDTLTQALTPNHLRGRVFGLRALLNTASGVLVNLAIWRLPAEDADALMIPALFALSGGMFLIAAYGMWRLLTNGPLPTKLANALWHPIRAYCLVWHRLRWFGRHRVPHDGPVILAANHTASTDPFLIQSATNRLVRWLMYKGYYFRIAGPLWRACKPILVEDDTSNLANLRKLMRVLNDGEAVGLFPEGTLQRNHRDLQPFKPGIAMLAVRTGATIVPVWIADTPIGASIWKFFLWPSRSTVRFGEPYKPDPAMSYEDIVEDLRQRMVALSQQSG